MPIFRPGGSTAIPIIPGDDSVITPTSQDLGDTLNVDGAITPVTVQMLAVPIGPLSGTTPAPDQLQVAFEAHVLLSSSDLAVQGIAIYVSQDTDPTGTPPTPPSPGFLSQFSLARATMAEPGNFEIRIDGNIPINNDFAATTNVRLWLFSNLDIQVFYRFMKLTPVRSYDPIP